MAVCLAIVIVPFSLASFVSSAISNAIRTDIATANDLTVKLSAQLGPPATQTEATTLPSGTPAAPASPLPAGLNEVDVITELQQFASTIRASSTIECACVSSGTGPFQVDSKKTNQNPRDVPTT